MTQTLKSSFDKIIHAARYQLPKHGLRYLFLRQADPNRFVWFEEQPDGRETETEAWGVNVEDAIKSVAQVWKNDPSFRMVNCGFRYTLPERDEHGLNALFQQMVASYTSMNGVYFDNDVGHNCFVQFASDEALNLWKNLQSKGKCSKS